jgi:hypothetical protein
MIKPPQGTPSHEELSNGVKRDKAIVVSKISTMCFLGEKFHHFSTKKNEEKCLR